MSGVYAPLRGSLVSVVLMPSLCADQSLYQPSTAAFPEPAVYAAPIRRASTKATPALCVLSIQMLSQHLPAHAAHRTPSQPTGAVPIGRHARVRGPFAPAYSELCARSFSTELWWAGGMAAGKIRGGCVAVKRGYIWDVVGVRPALRSGGSAF